MHELSLIAQLFEIMNKKAAEEKARKITFVKLKVGALSGAVPELLESAFHIYKKDSLASEAKLAIEKIPLRVQCQDCQAEFFKDDFILTCSACCSTRLKILSGTELLLEKMELEID